MRSEDQYRQKHLRRRREETDKQRMLQYKQQAEATRSDDRVRDAVHDAVVADSVRTDSMYAGHMMNEKLSASC